MADVLALPAIGATEPGRQSEPAAMMPYRDKSHMRFI
jgi:hypothetical protein